MTRVPLVLCILIGLLLAVSVSATPFINPPEDNATADEWKTQFPYQRNALLDFVTSPATWPSDPNGPQGSLDLVPGPDYDLEGWDDPDLFPSDWLLIEGDYVWADSVPGLPGNRTGILVFDNTTGNDPLLAQVTWHLDNWPDPRLQKDVWSELIWFQTGTETSLGVGIVTPGGHRIADMWYLFNPASQLPDGWLINDGYVRIEPNPEWEEMVVSLTVAPGEAFFIDSWHTATECVPEPGTIGLFGLGIAGLIYWRRRKAS